MILSISMFATRLLGVVYVIPFQQMVGETGMALYSHAYNIYGLFLSLSTLGIPVGMAKFISRYNAKEDYFTSRRIFRFGLIFMTILGVVGFTILYFIAPLYARWVLSGVPVAEQYHSVSQIATAIRAVSFALIIIPPMAIFRGFFQGNQDMVPSSISQFIEQLVRVVFIIAGTFFIIRVLGMSTEAAVSFSVFAALLSGIAAFLVLLYYWMKNKRKFDALLKTSDPTQKSPDISHLFLELISYAIPFALLGLAANAYIIIDNGTLLGGLEHYGYNSLQATAAQGIFTGSLFKIIMIPVSFAIAFGQPLVPELTRFLTAGNGKEVRRVLIQAIQLTCFITIPAVIGLTILSHPIYVMLFGRGYEEMNIMGGEIFRVGASIGLFMALYSIVMAILQGIGAQFYGIALLAISLVIKFAGNVLLLPRFGVWGGVIATNAAFGFCIVGSLFIIKKRTHLKFGILIRKLAPTFIFSAIMALVVGGGRFVLYRVFPFNETSRLSGITYIAALGLLGIATYFGLAWYFDVFQSLFGFSPSLKGLLNRLRRRKQE
ncbi:MAG: polysaccharide biosynthesis protein [Turicibacter sp.]|nr:polysaccharide biosynthesis protein [Turicibacter sp.]